MTMASGHLTLITRPLEDAEVTAAELNKLGIATLIEPLLHIHTDNSMQPLLIEALASQPQCCITTSANGVRALAALSDERKIALITVGQKTADIAKNLGFTNVTTGGEDVTGLASTIISTCRPEQGGLLYLTGHITTGDLDTQLRQEGFSLKRLVLYHAKASQNLSDTCIHALTSRHIQRIILYSARTASIFADIIASLAIEHTLRTVDAVCLSQKVADAINHLTWQTILTARHPTQESLFAILR